MILFFSVQEQVSFQYPTAACRYFYLSFVAPFQSPVLFPFLCLVLLFSQSSRSFAFWQLHRCGSWMVLGSGFSTSLGRPKARTPLATGQGIAGGLSNSSSLMYINMNVCMYMFLSRQMRLHRQTFQAYRIMAGTRNR